RIESQELNRRWPASGHIKGAALDCGCATLWHFEPSISRWAVVAARQQQPSRLLQTDDDFGFGVNCEPLAQDETIIVHSRERRNPRTNCQLPVHERESNSDCE